MNYRVRQQPRFLRRIPSIRLRYLLTLPLALWCIIGLVFVHGWQSSWLEIQNLLSEDPDRMPTAASPLPKLAQRVPCFGPRGKLLNQSPDDDLVYADLETDYPPPFLGSHRELGADTSWMTAAGRYGAYGYHEEQPSYNRSRVDWDKVDWGALQDACVDRNKHRFHANVPAVAMAHQPRFEWRNRTSRHPTPPWHAFETSRRTAIVLRSYEGFGYTAEDMWSIRSLIAETALRTGGEYAVILLVNIQDKGRNIFASRRNYDAALEAARIPPELRSIAVLWDDHLLQSWYPRIEEHRTMWQVNQPLQLFALHYPEYEHVWQMEMDQRFLGDAGRYLDAVAEFARNEPRKQALERATYAYSPALSGSYDDFLRSVDAANHGGSRAWGPVHIPDIKPIGPAPPVERPEDDDFWWGVGDDADVIVTSFCADVLQSSWVFRDWIQGASLGVATPRWFCPPAIMRGSRTLLLAVHEAQVRRGLTVPSEAVLPTWALWHGLKLSYPPQPAYMRPAGAGDEPSADETSRNRTEWKRPDARPWFGHTPDESPDGLSHADPQSFADRGMTWWWTSNWPRHIMNVWLYGEAAAHGDVPDVLRLRNGTLYAPNMAMHPVKTNPS